MARFPKDSSGKAIPQFRTFSNQRRRGRTLAWVVMGGSVAILALALLGPALLRLIPSRYIVAYAPEFVQRMVANDNPQENLPSAEGAATVDVSELLQDLGPTPTALPAEAGTPVATTEAASISAEQAFAQPTSIAGPTPTVTPAYVPPQAEAAVVDGDAASLTESSTLLTGFTHTYQMWNNCGPATVTTALTYYDDSFTQTQAATYLKPNLEDRNVRPEEIVSYLRSEGYEGTYRINGDLALLKTLLHNGYPVMVEKGFDPEPDRLGWMGHYLLLTGFNDQTEEFITMDSYLGPNRGHNYTTLENFWRQFNHTYIVVHRPDQTSAVASIIGEEMDDLTMYSNGLYAAQADINLDSNDAYAWFNLGTNLTALGRYEQAATAFDEARRVGLPWRMLWYQFSPYEAYYRVGRLDDVILLADTTLANNGYAEESYYYKGLARLGNEDLTGARRDFENALRNNPNYTAAEQKLAEVLALIEQSS